MYHVTGNGIIGEAMARPGITLLDVKDAIAELQGQEKNITVDHIREMLGTGSRSTINNHLKTWRSQTSDAGLNDPTLPSELISLIKGLWENMRSKANDTITQHQTQCDEKIEAAEVKFENTKQALATSEKQQQNTSALLQQKTELADQLQTKLNIEQQESHKLNERISSLESRRQDSVDENKKLHTHIKNIQANLEHYQNAMQKKQEQQSLELDKQRHEQIRIESSLKREIEQLNQTAVHLTVEKESTVEKLLLLTEQHNQLIQEHKAIDKEFIKLQTKHESLEPQHQALQKQHQETQAALLSKRLEAERLQAELTAQFAAADEIKLNLVKTKEKLENAETKIMKLASEKSQLGEKA